MSEGATGAPDLTAAPPALASPGGRAYWMSLEELVRSPEFLARAQQAFPGFAGALAESCDRRRFLQLAAASMALMGLAACGPEVQPRDREPYVEQPEGIVPGRARYYATATELQGYGTGVLIEHVMGRPIKVEGNPEHPASLGASSAIAQASILGLYDPYRAQAVTRDGELMPWQALVSALLGQRQALQRRAGRGLAVLTGASSSPTLAAQLAELQRTLPAMRWYQWEAVSRDNVRAAAVQAFGRPLELVTDFAAAEVIVAVDSDFLDAAPGHLRFARDFASRRRAAEVKGRMSRLYALESTPTLAGAKADHCWPLDPAAIDGALRRLAGALGAGPREWASLEHPRAHALDVMAAELSAARGLALLHLGASQSAANHALAHAINESLGAFGTLLQTIEPVVNAPPEAGSSLADLNAALRRDEVEVLLVLDASNPAYTAPADLDFTAALRRAPFSLYLGQYADETAAATHWHVPQRHELEAWGDTRAYDGTVTLQQPQLRMRAQRCSAQELLAVLLGDPAPDAQQLLRRQWQDRLGSASPSSAPGLPQADERWIAALRRGVVPNTAAAVVNARVRNDLASSLPAPRATTALTLLFRPDPYLWDGRFADNGWLQELGRPFTRLTWDNAVLVAPVTAARLGLNTADVVEIIVADRALSAPVWVLPGQAEECLTLELGFGRRRAGPVGEGVGADAYRLRTSNAPWRIAIAAPRKLGSGYRFASIQREMTTHHRDVLKEGTLAQFLHDPQFLRESQPEQRPPESLYPAFQYPGIAWAMSINLNACIGCHACVAACQAENNSPVVGKTEVWRDHDMHWLRIDRYYAGSPEAPQVVFEPVPCMHCENAPCEVVCPVHATVHDSEGLNVMIYNRCVGTRFCSNNCPYKVRRFNFFDYSAPDPRPGMSWNPEVTVRGRGVMEKCTYCIQRTRAAMIDADRENRRVQDGEVRTACQQACPTQAITFGDRNDPTSAVAARKASPLDFVMLRALNTRPRTSYEALIRNPNPQLPHA